MTKIEPKPGDILWIVSHCKTASKRRTFVNEFRAVSDLAVDVYGKCNHRPLPKGKENEMYDMYYFYFALENSLCGDYVTEKFFKVLNFNTIPIVRGASRR